MASGSHPCASEGGLRASARVLPIDGGLSLIDAVSRLRLASESCCICDGAGRRPRAGVCNCVLRAIFRRVMQQAMTPGRDPYCPRRTGVSKAYSYPALEYAIDVERCAEQHLSAEQLRIFRLRYLDGADWRTCCRLLQMDRGLFHHTIYRIEEKLGRAFLELEPCALYPVHEYFRLRRPVKAERWTDLPPAHWYREAIFRRVQAAA